MTTFPEQRFLGYPSGSLVAEASDLGWGPGVWPREFALAFRSGDRVLYARGPDVESLGTVAVRYEPVLPEALRDPERFPPVDVLND
jgi:hypothetical protein